MGTDRCDICGRVNGTQAERFAPDDAYWRLCWRKTDAGDIRCSKDLAVVFADLARVVAERDALRSRLIELGGELLSSQLVANKWDHEKSWIPQDIAIECHELLDRAGMGRPGTPNTFVAMVKEAVEKLRDQQEAIRAWAKKQLHQLHDCGAFEETVCSLCVELDGAAIQAVAHACPEYLKLAKEEMKSAYVRRTKSETERDQLRADNERLTQELAEAQAGAAAMREQALKPYTFQDDRSGERCALCGEVAGVNEPMVHATRCALKAYGGADAAAGEK